jgi:hypothetical protein
MSGPDRTVGLQYVEGFGISRQLANKVSKIVSLMRQPHLPTRIYRW